jgi:hypothetical protein
MPRRFPGLRATARIIGVAVTAAALGVASTHASTPKFFQAATQPDFLKGEVENLSIDSQGRLMLAPAAELVYETSAPFLWSVCAGSDGALFVGTGNEGKVFRIDQQGKGSIFFDAPELEVHALARHPTAVFTSRRRRMGGSTRSIATGPTRSSSILTTSTSGLLRSIRRATCSLAPASKG